MPKRFLNYKGATLATIYETDEVVANPTLEGNEETLEGLEIGKTKYKVGGEGGSKVVANPELTGDEQALEGLEVEGTKYKVSGGGSSYTPGNGISIDSNNEITAKLGSNLTFDNRGRITTDLNVLVTDNQGSLYQPLKTGNSSGYSINYTSGGNTYTSQFSSNQLQVTKPEYAAIFATDHIDYYLDQFLAQNYPTININAGQAGQAAITHINIPHNPTAGTTVTYTLATTADLQALIDRIAALEQALQNNNN